MSELEVTIESDQQAVVLRLKGSADMEGTAILRNALRNVTSGPTRDVLVDMEQLAFMCSLGLGALVEAHTLLKNNGVKLMLVNPTPAVRKVLKTTQLVRLFTIYNSIKEALEIPAQDKG